jgi:hypothetical protein
LESGDDDQKRRGALFGTSTWRYPGWKGLVYDDYPAKVAPALALRESRRSNRRATPRVYVVGLEG